MGSINLSSKHVNVVFLCEFFVIEYNNYINQAQYLKWCTIRGILCEGVILSSVVFFAEKKKNYTNTIFF